MPPGVRIAGAVLAAGSGVRLGAPKAEVVVGGTRLLDRAVAALRDGGCDPLLAVVRAGTPVLAAQAVVNPDPSRGQRSSLALAVDACAGEVDALAVLLVDLPGVGADAIAAVVRAWRPGRIIAAGYGGRRGHPIVMSLPDWRLAVRLAGPDEGARALLAAHADRVDQIDVDGDPADLDTPDDLARWRHRSGGDSPAVPGDACPP
jgi:CTP:molybdopterin cytidylyltransferase MocA